MQVFFKVHVIASAASALVRLPSVSKPSLVRTFVGAANGGLKSSLEDALDQHFNTRMRSDVMEGATPCELLRDVDQYKLSLPRLGDSPLYRFPY